MTKEPLVVIGFSGNALDAFDTLQANHELLAFLDDNAALHGSRFRGVPILPLSSLSDYGAANVVCLIGSEQSYLRRADIINRLDLPKERFATIVDPRAHVSGSCALGRGVLVYPGVVITSDAVIGDHVLVLPQTVIHHEATVGDFSLVGSRVVIAGRVKVGRACYVGSGSSIKNGVDLGDGCLVGMSANVIRNVASRSVVVGNPARVLRHP